MYFLDFQILKIMVIESKVLVLLMVACHVTEGVASSPSSSVWCGSPTHPL